MDKINRSHKCTEQNQIIIMDLSGKNKPKVMKYIYP